VIAKGVPPAAATPAASPLLLIVASAESLESHAADRCAWRSTLAIRLRDSPPTRRLPHFGVSIRFVGFTGTWNE